MSATALISPRSLVEGRRPLRHPAALVACVVLVVAFLALLVTYHSKPFAVPASRAVALVRADRYSDILLAHGRAQRLMAMPLDQHFDQVYGYRGNRIVFTADVSVHGLVEAQGDLSGKSFAFGSRTASRPAVLCLLCLTFVLMTAVWPLRRLRNLDVLVAVSLASAVVLFDLQYVKWMVFAAYPALAYLAGRAAWQSLGRPRRPAPSVPLFDQVTAGWNFTQRRRALRCAAVAAGLITVMVGLSSLHVVDVGIAVMEGATLLWHGMAPYGHIRDVLHGDTYPLGTYLLYMPLAWLTPVRDNWGNVDLTLGAAVGSALATAWCLARGGRRGTPGAGEQAAALERLRAAVAWLTFPTVLLTVSTGTTDVGLAVFLVVAILVWRRPVLASSVLAAGAWFKLAPAVLMPFTLARLRGKALAHALVAVTGICAAMLALLVAVGGAGAVHAMLVGLSYQQTRISPHNLWATVGSVPGQQLAEAVTLALIAGGTVRIWQLGPGFADRRRVAALFGAVLLCAQISANYWSLLYLAWVVPLLCLSLWSPSLEGAQEASCRSAS